LMFKEASSTLVDREVKGTLVTYFIKCTWTCLLSLICFTVESSWGLPKSRTWLGNSWCYSNRGSFTGEYADRYLL
jgi:hypothetical protein